MPFFLLILDGLDALSCTISSRDVSVPIVSCSQLKKKMKKIITNVGTPTTAQMMITLVALSLDPSLDPSLDTELASSALAETDTVAKLMPTTDTPSSPKFSSRALKKDVALESMSSTLVKSAAIVAAVSTASV